MKSASNRVRFSRKNRPNKRVRSALVETLEPRVLLASVVWDGEAGDNDWNNQVNWVGNVQIPNQVGDDAVFQDVGVGVVDLMGVTHTIKSIRF
ncbi:MAG: hypothetical protein ACI9G1_005572, partial [Pirellulaceae bacterium]